jgi:hypothetical protein
MMMQHRPKQKWDCDATQTQAKVRRWCNTVPSKSKMVMQCRYKQKSFAWVCVGSPCYFCLCQCCMPILLLLVSALHHHLTFAWNCVASPSYFCLGLCCITISLLLGSVLHHHITFAWVCVASPSYFCFGQCCITILLLLGYVLPQTQSKVRWWCNADTSKSNMMMQHIPKQK